MSLKQGTQTGKIAVVGEKELVLGYRLLGVEDAVTVTKGDAQKVLLEYFNSGEYDLIIVGSEAGRGLSAATREKFESSVVPLIVFMPSTDSAVAEESISKLAKRVLGVDLRMGA